MNARKRRSRAMSFNALFAVFLGTSLPAVAVNPALDLATGPLISAAANIHPNLLLALSVEFPTVGAAYRSDGGSYNRRRDYVGYFNHRMCYAYNGGNRNLTDSGYFYPIREADPQTHECGGGAFSGNFMNWATSSAIDMLRYALTGGDRIIDTARMTVLQRAVLHDSAANNFYAHAIYFPRRIVSGGGDVSPPGQVTPFNTATLHIVSCRNRILFSDRSSGVDGSRAADSQRASAYCTSTYDGLSPPNPDQVDKRLGEYLARVKVCDETEGPARPDLCKRYGNAYKPAGEIQRNADRLRVGAMGYLLDDGPRRYGGVLRAPIKYTGDSRINPESLAREPNERREWDPDTGRFYPNPENPADRDNVSVNSGVINYLNKFGRSGLYKTYDPIGELYYEALRYFQGKTPSYEATAGMTDVMKDGFPVIEGWTDPVIASCQKNAILTIADVNTHWDRYIPGNDRTTYNGGNNAFDSARPADPPVANRTPGLDVKDWTRRVGEMEADAGGLARNPAPNVALRELENRDTGAGGHGTYYMAGLAYWANTNDIRLDKPTRVKTYAIDVDEGGNGLIDGNTRTIKPRDSQLYLAAKYGGFEDRNRDGNPFVTLAADGVHSVPGSEWDDGSGVPANYFLASQPQALLRSIRTVFSRVGNLSGTMSAVAVSSSRISGDGANVFQPGFDAATWSGSLRKFRLALGADGMAVIAATPDWDAGDVLTGSENPARAARPVAADRNIYTFRDDNMSTVAFLWGQLSAAQQASLNLSADGVRDGLGTQRLAYLRGQRDAEVGRPGGMFRRRDRVLGDIVNSNTVYVAAPAPNGIGDGYQEHYAANKERAQAVYVGANDGMLHAFSASDGRELFAYVPNALIGSLSRLTDPDYEHRPYADGQIAVAEARARGRWRTVLAAGMGAGAQGVYALDVTDPARFEAGAGALFEFTDADDPDMGNVVGTPVIAKFRTGIVEGVPRYAYFLVVASGVNNGREDGADRFNADGVPALFLLSLDKAAPARWQLGVNYFKYRVASGVTGLANGLGTPAIVIDSNGAARYAYAGDLQGNLWRFDFSGSAPWSGAMGAGGPIFAAVGPDGTRQPISVQPRVVFAPAGGYVILFGTGRLLENADLLASGFRPQSFYAIHDPATVGARVGGRSDLARRQLRAGNGAYAISGDAFEYGSGGTARKGWFLDFYDSGRTGERLVANPLVSGGTVLFNSMLPSDNPCVAGGGRTYILDALSGLPLGGASTGSLSTVGVPGTPVAFEVEARTSDRNAVGRRTVRRRQVVFNFGTGGVAGMAAPSGDAIQGSVPAGRFSWREIANWQELRAGAGN